MRSWISIAIFSVALSGCSMPFVEIKYIPPDRNTQTSNTPGEQEQLPPTVALTYKSKTKTRAGKKSFIINAAIDPDFADSIGLSGENCVQAGSWDSGEVVVDFANTPCPAPGTLVPADNIMFSLFYEETSKTEYKLYVGKDTWGAVAIDIGAQTATLSHLCTGEYYGLCQLILVTGKFSDLK